jgi:hypothetical protein
MATLLKTNDRIRTAIQVYNTEFAYKLNGVLLSFTGSRIKGYQLYFKDSVSDLVTCTIYTGNEKAIITAIDTIYQFTGSNSPVIKTPINYPL